jgi:cobalt-zinc-cadmium efflux system outer membrane protein
MSRFRNVSTLLFVLGVLTHPASVTAQSALTSVHGATLPEAIAAALARNPDVLTAEAVLDSARAERSIAREYPNPVLSGQPNTPYQYVAAIPLDITPRRRWRVVSGTLGAQASDADRRDVVRQTTLAVARAFYDALLADERRRIAGERRAAVRQILAGDSARLRTGDIAEHVLARSEIEAVRAQADLDRADVDAQHARIALQAVMGVDHPDTAFTAIGTLDYRAVALPDSNLVDVAYTRRPDYRAAATRVEQSRSAQRAASALLIPVPELSLARQFSAPFGNGQYYSVGLAFELPSINTYRGERERAAAGANASSIGQRRVAMQIERDVVSALSDFRLQRSLIERYQAGVLAKVAATVSAEQYAYSRGAVTLTDLLDVLRAQQDGRTEYASAEHDYWVSVYALGAALGVDLLAAR